MQHALLGIAWVGGVMAYVCLFTFALCAMDAKRQQQDGDR